MSPELICEKDYNTSTDYFSLGVLFYLCLFGQYPFSGEYNGSVYISMKMIEFYDRDHLLDMVPPFYRHHQEVLQLLDLLFEKDISKRKECISSLPLHHLLVCTLDHLSQLEYFNDISFSQLYLSHPSLQTDYEQQVETICKEIINKTRTVRFLFLFPLSRHCQTCRTPFTRRTFNSIFSLITAIIHPTFTSTPLLFSVYVLDCSTNLLFLSDLTAFCMPLSPSLILDSNHYYYPNDYQQHSYWKEDFSCLFLILYPSQLQDLNSFLELLQRFLVNHHHYRTLFLYIDHINTCSSVSIYSSFHFLDMAESALSTALYDLRGHSNPTASTPLSSSTTSLFCLLVHSLSPLSFSLDIIRQCISFMMALLLPIPIWMVYFHYSLFDAQNTFEPLPATSKALVPISSMSLFSKLLTNSRTTTLLLQYAHSFLLLSADLFDLFTVWRFDWQLLSLLSDSLLLPSGPYSCILFAYPVNSPRPLWYSFVYSFSVSPSF